jgi:hypothetical protein
MNKSRLNIRALKVAVAVRWFNCHGKALLPRSFKQAAQLHTQAKKAIPIPLLPLFYVCEVTVWDIATHNCNHHKDHHFHMMHARPCCSSDCSSNSINLTCL